MVNTKAERDAFIEKNMGLVHSLCKRFIGKGIEYDDLFQAGCMGLVKAYDAFDDERGICFSTYAVPVILGEVRRLFRDGGSVKISRSLKELNIRIIKERENFEKQNAIEPSISQLAAALKVTPEEIAEALCASQPVVSLTGNNDEGHSEIELPVLSGEEQITNRLTIEAVLGNLSETEQKIIKHRYFEYLTQNKTAEQLNISQVQVSRYEKKALCKLRKLLS